jgi:hypothetical protein
MMSRRLTSFLMALLVAMGFGAGLAASVTAQGGTTGSGNTCVQEAEGGGDRGDSVTCSNGNAMSSSDGSNEANAGSNSNGQGQAQASTTGHGNGNGSGQASNAAVTGIGGDGAASGEGTTPLLEDDGGLLPEAASLVGLLIAILLQILGA